MSKDNEFEQWYLTNDSTDPLTRREKNIARAAWYAATEARKARDLATADESIAADTDLFNRGYEQGKAWQKAKDLAVVEAAETLHNELATARRVLARIVDDLPRNRDWLDPDLERAAVAIANRELPPEITRRINSAD